MLATLSRVQFKCQVDDVSCLLAGGGWVLLMLLLLFLLSWTTEKTNYFSSWQNASNETEVQQSKQIYIEYEVHGKC